MNKEKYLAEGFFPGEAKHMPKKKMPRNPQPDEHGDYVPVLFVRMPAEADEYVELLNDHDIPAVVADRDAEEGKPFVVPQSPGRGIPVLVPENLLDDASEVIADREDLDEFGEGEEDDVEDDEDEEDFGLGEVAPDDLLGDEEEEEESLFGDGDGDDDDEEEEEEEDDEEF